MNEMQHLTTPTGLKFCLALCFSSGPNSSKFGPSCPQVGSNFFHLAKEMATTFLEPERTLQYHIFVYILFKVCFVTIEFIKKKKKKTQQQQQHIAYRKGACYNIFMNARTRSTTQRL